MSAEAASSTKTLNLIGIKQPEAERKVHISLNIRKIDNGFILSANIDRPNKYESVELAITSLPKLLKAIATFLKATDLDPKV